MTGGTLRLRAYEVWSALEVVDPVAVLAEDLIGRSVDRSGHTRRPSGRLLPWHGAGISDELVVLDHPEASIPCVMPAHSLRAALAAALTAVAARELLQSGGVTLAMLGPAESTQAQLPVIARQVPGISHVALCLDNQRRSIDPKLADQLELADIGLSVVPTLAEAVFGASLVVATNHGAGGQDLDTLRLGRLAHGAVLVNATGRDLPEEVADQADQVFVDDFGLLEDHRDRRVAAHLTAHAPSPTATPGGAGSGIAADLAQLLTGRHPGRERGDGAVLVELLGVDQLNAELAYRIHQAAMRTGLGVRIAN